MPKIGGFMAHLLTKTGTNPFNKVASVRDLTLNIDSTEIDVSDHDTREWVDTIAGLKRWTLSGGMLYVDDNATQDVLFDLLSGLSVNNTILVQFCPQSASDGPPPAAMPGRYFEGSGSVGRWSLGAPQNDAAAVNFEIRGRGKIERKTQT